MSRSVVALTLAVAALAGCSKLVDIVTPTLDLKVNAPSIVFTDDTTQATAVLVHQHGGEDPVSATWRTSDASVITIGSDGKFVGHIEGRQATITASYQGQNASLTITVRTDDRRMGYALADQPTAAATYTPDANYSFNSSGGVNEVTRTATGVYAVRFAGLGRENGERDNMQVTAYGTPGAYCKPTVWTSVGADMTVTVSCFIGDGTPLDSRFTMLLVGARAFGPQTPIAFVLAQPDSGALILDTASTSRNSTGGHVLYGFVSEGAYALQFPGMVKASGSSPLGIEVTTVGQNPRRCRLIALDLTTDGAGINCARPVGGGPGDSPFSFLWLTHGKPNERFAYAWADNASSTVAYSPNATFAYNSSGGGISARRTGTGQYQLVFAGLARPAGRKEIVGVSSAWQDSNRLICNITTWGNSGADLVVNVACYDLTAAPVNGRFTVYVIE